MDIYERQEVRGEGSYGQVYRGAHRQFEIPVALKYITKAGKSKADMAEIYREIELLKSFNHPNIVKLLDTYETATDFCLVMELAEGDLLKSVVAGQALPQEVVCKLGSQIISALAYLHRHKIIHRDVKPANFLRFANGSIKLCDFGIALELPADGYVRNCHKGTIRYTAPEVMNYAAYSLPADIYSLGISLYELLAGFSPYEFCPQLDLREHIGDIKFPPFWSSEMVQVLQWMLSRDPDRRPTIHELSQHPLFQGETSNQFSVETSDVANLGWVQPEFGVLPFDPASISDVPLEQVPLVAPINASQSLQEVSIQGTLAQAKRQASDALALAQETAAVAQQKAVAAQQAQLEAEKALILSNQAAASFLLAQRHLNELEVLAHSQAGAPDDTLAVRIADIEAQEEALRGRSAAVSQREVEVLAREAAVKLQEESLVKREEAVSAAMKRIGAPIQLRGDSVQEDPAQQAVKKEDIAEPSERAIPEEQPSPAREQSPAPNEQTQQLEACHLEQDCLVEENEPATSQQGVATLPQPCSNPASTHELSPTAAATEGESEGQAEVAEAKTNTEIQACKKRTKKRQGAPEKAAKKTKGRPPWR